MPQLVKGGKWTYGWVVIDSEGRLLIPPKAWEEYEFSKGDEFLAILASHVLGGLGITTRRRLKHNFPIKILALLELEDECRLCLPNNLLEQVGIAKGARVLTVRGSQYALGYVK